MFRNALEVVLGLLVMLCLGTGAVTAQPPDPLSVTWKPADEGLYQLMFTVPVGTKVEIIEVQKLDSDSNWKTFEPVSAEVLRSGRLGLYSNFGGRIRLKLTTGDHECFSHEIDVRDGKLLSDQDLRPQLDANVAFESATTAPAPEGEADTETAATPIAVTVSRVEGSYRFQFPPDLAPGKLRLTKVYETAASSNPFPTDVWTYEPSTQLFSYKAPFAGFFERVTGTVSLHFVGDLPYVANVKGSDLVALKTAGLPIAGEETSAAAIAKQLKTKPPEKHFRNLVVSQAQSWTFHPAGGQLVFRYDHTPELTAKEIAQVLRKTAKNFVRPNLDDARRQMVADFQTFYKTGERPYLLKNPYIEDWQPFLKHLQSVVEKEIGNYQADNDDEVLEQFVLAELADGFDDLAAKIEQVKELGPSGVPGSFAQPGNGGGSGETYGRRRRGVRCWNLLFGL